MGIFAVLALQGSFSLHKKALERVGIKAKLVTQPKELAGASALVIPGGESTSILKLMTPLNWQEAIIEFCGKGHLIFGTCAGMILLSKSIDTTQNYLGLIDIKVKRNAYGRQIESFTAVGTSDLNPLELEMACIRAPQVTFVDKSVEILASLENRPMLLRQDNVIVATFHPELNENLSLYHWLNNISK